MPTRTESPLGEPTPDTAKAELRAMCLRAWDIALAHGWDVTIDARPRGRDGYSFIVNTDVVRHRNLPLVTADQSEVTP